MASASKRQDVWGAPRYGMLHGRRAVFEQDSRALCGVILCNVPRKGTNAPGGWSPCELREKADHAYGDCTNQVESYFSALRRVELGQHYPNAVNDRNTNRPCFESISAHVRDARIAPGAAARRIALSHYLRTVSRAAFAPVEIETTMSIDLDLDESSYTRDCLGWLGDITPAIGNQMK